LPWAVSVIEKRPMTSGPAFVCSMCRKPIPVGGKVIRCSVSTCNSGKLKLVFCSPACWDSHLPDARHRSAYFVEEVARRLPGAGCGKDRSGSV
jgi:hypothetical protein